MMKTLPNHSKAVIATALLAVLFASGCERRTPPAATGTATPGETPAAQGTNPVSPSTTMPSDAMADKSKTPGAVIDDAVLTTKVKTALLADSDIQGLSVNVETSKGVVTLNGAVNNQAQIDRATKITGQVGGVGSVVNNLTIKKQ
jgi:hyperosmotically inducible protein